MQIFLDCDGVLANFDKRAFEIFGMPPRKFEEKHGSKEFWKRIRGDDEFFSNLELMPDAKELWNWCKPYNPIILTGVPYGNWAQPQKICWAKKMLNTDRIICCLSREKIKYAKKGDILVDDTLKYRHLWEDELGGKFIHHISAKSSISELKKILKV